MPVVLAVTTVLRVVYNCYTLAYLFLSIASGGDGGGGDCGGVGVVVGMVTMVVDYWWWWSSGGCDSLFKASSCNACRSAIGKCMLHGVLVVVCGEQDKSHYNHYFHHHQLLTQQKKSPGIQIDEFFLIKTANITRAVTITTTIIMFPSPLFWGPILIIGGSVINRGYHVYFYLFVELGLLLYLRSAFIW